MGHGEVDVRWEAIREETIKQCVCDEVDETDFH